MNERREAQTQTVPWTPASDYPIDAVVTWVDGSDPRHRQKLARYLHNLSLTPQDASKTRFRSSFEIRYCVLSLLKFAPYLRNIYLVTDHQAPPIFADVKRWFPERVDSLRLIDHTEIFRDYEHLLPTFSSYSIETMLFRIPGLSETFIYLNDDMILVNRTEPADWFVAGQPVLRGRWRRSPLVERLLRVSVDFLMRHLFRSPHSLVRSGYKLGQWQAARRVGFRRKYFWSDHTPHPLRKSILEDFYQRNPAMLEKNASYRLRNHEQYNPQALAFHLELRQGNSLRQPENVVCMKPVKRRADYVPRKLRLAEKDPIQFLCVQSLDLARTEDQDAIHAWLERRITTQ